MTSMDYNVNGGVRLLQAQTCLILASFHSDTVMCLMREIDPNGVNLRKSHRLCRRIYYSKVCLIFIF